MLRYVERQRVIGSSHKVSMLKGGEPNVIKQFNQAKTIGLFQFESAGMRAFLKNLKPTVFDDEDTTEVPNPAFDIRASTMNIR